MEDGNKQMRKLNLGCGSNILSGWENHDADLDITKPLPHEDNSIDFIFAEHVVEHTTTPDAVRFFTESYRILKPDGILRIAVPSVDKIYDLADGPYLKWHGQSGFGDGSKRKAVQSILLDHGHLSAWNHSILEACFFAAGFDSDKICGCGFSELEGHGKVIGDHNNEIETIIMEAVK
jgi:predicted SAM-dependent methyltransferase